MSRNKFTALECRGHRQRFSSHDKFTLTVSIAEHAPCTDRNVTRCYLSLQYCAGRTPRLLAQLGFNKVEHRNEDFYRIIRDGKQPAYDVLVTNPPYSGEHKRLCLEYCKESGKPWFLLIPNYVATKDYYKANMLGPSVVEGGEPFYVVPRSCYLFDHPEGTGHAESPFFGIWFVHCGSHNEEIFRGLEAQRKGSVSILRTLEDLSARGAVQTARRPNPRQRKKMKRKLVSAHDEQMNR